MKLSKITRVKIQHLLRSLRLLSLVEQVRFYFKKWSLKKKNKLFFQQNPDITMPPEFLAFDAYSAPDWNFYKNSGEKTALFIADIADKFFNTDRPIQSIYEWGCGPGRVIRNLPIALGDSVNIFGSDYNQETIEWCKKSIPEVSFFINNLNPPLPQPDNKFDFIYAISVFTHLSETTCLDWAEELFRVLSPNGILLITTSGDNAYHSELLDLEKMEYETKGVVVRGSYEEGKKMYLTKHSPRYVRDRLLKNFDILQHEPAGFPFISQDYWIARKQC